MLRNVSDRRRRILAILPGLGGHGGIQRQNRALCGVIADWAQEHHAELHVVSLADAPLWFDRRYVSRPVTGCGGRRHMFGVAAGLALLRRCDLVIIGVADFGVFVAEQLMVQPRVPVLTVAHGIEVWQPLPPQQRLALTRATGVLAVSEYTADTVARVHGVRRERIVVVPNPLSNEFVEGAAAFERSGAPALGSDILAIARMNRIDREKGIETLIRAVAALPARTGFRCTIVGDGEDRPRLESLASELGLAQCVRFVGAVPDEKLHAYLAGARVFALPSRKEGFGIVYLEAMYYGKPVVAGAHGGAPEVVSDGYNGFLVQYGDVKGLADALQRLLSEEQAAAAMGAAGRCLVKQRFSQAVFAESVAGMLQHLLLS